MNDVRTGDDTAAGGIDALRENLAKVIRGKNESLDLLIVALLAGGSVLMEDVPGVGKTTLAKALARSLEVSFNRVQFTPDLLPADILGSSVFLPNEGEFSFREGPIFCHVLLADEINRASPRTQSALLEAMSEAQTTIEGVRRELPTPFVVLATQNPVDFHGTYPLPEAQLDRFLMQLDLGYPDAETELDILYDRAESDPLDAMKPVLSRDTVVDLQTRTRKVGVEQSVAQYLLQLIAATREDAKIELGVSPRGSLMLFRAAQARALMCGREFVLPDDVQELAVPVLAHRLILGTRHRYDGESKAGIIRWILKSTPVPR